jgi:hypothetical protein
MYVKMKLKLSLPLFGYTFGIASPAATIAADTEAAVFIPEIWANRALGQLRAQTCMVGLSARDYEDSIASYGDTVNVQKRGTLVTNDKTPNTAVTLQNPTATTIPVVLDNHKEVSFLVEDVAEAQANLSVLDGYVEDGAIVLGEPIDVALLGEYANVAAGNVITLSAGIDEDDFLAARTNMVITGKSGNRPRYMVIRDLAEIITVDKFVSRDYTKDGSLEDAAIGKLAGFQIFENNNVIQTTSPSRTHRLYFVKGSICLVTRRLPNPPADTGVKSATIVEDGVALRVLYGYNMDFLGMQVTLDILFGTKILRSEWTGEIR